MTACACMGPQHGDPLCYCRMQAAGLKPSKAYEWTDEKKEELSKVFSKIFNQRKENNDQQSGSDLAS